MEVDQLALNIFTTGKLMRDLIFQIQSRQMEKIGKRKAFADMTLPQLHAILMIHMQGRVSISELSQLLRVSPPSASVMVDRLVEKKVLIRKPCKTDRRKVEIRISEKVVDTIQEVESAIYRFFIRLVEEIGTEAATQWYEVLERIKPILQRETDNP